MRFTTIDLFAGAGGVSEALKKKFKIIAAVEYDPIISSSYALNHGKQHLLVRDITKITKKNWLDLKKKELGDNTLDLLVATPPCQGFSRHSRKKSNNNMDARNELVLEIIKISNIFKPKYILFENVDNIVNFKIFLTFLDSLNNLNLKGRKVNPRTPSYHIKCEVVDAIDYGVPQRRKRLIMIAKRIDVFPQPDAKIDTANTKSIFSSNHNVWPARIPAPTLGEYFKRFNLAKIQAGEQDNSDKLHRCRNLSDLNLKRIKFTPKNGGSRSDWPEHENLGLECHKKNNVSFGDVYGRMNFENYAPTITCGCLSYTKGRFGHPTEDRAISLREAALIQTFPLWYKFTGKIDGNAYEGSTENIATQIGNAVPVKLAETFISRITFELLKENGVVNNSHQLTMNRANVR